MSHSENQNGPLSEKPGAMAGLLDASLTITTQRHFPHGKEILADQDEGRRGRQLRSETGQYLTSRCDGVNDCGRHDGKPNGGG